MDISTLVAELLDPAKLLVHVPYALLVISMMMNDMGWLRVIAIAAGLIRILNRAFFEVDHVIVVWEIAFVAVNVIQLAILWYYAKRHSFTEDERRFLDILPAAVDRRIVRRLLRLGTHVTAPPGARLTVEGEPVQHLAFITEGVAQVERAGTIIAVCGPGDFVGEMSFATRQPASATVVCARPVRYFSFDQQALRRAVERDSAMQQALDAGFSRNLALKLGRTATSPPDPA